MVSEILLGPPFRFSGRSASLEGAAHGSALSTEDSEVSVEVIDTFSPGVVTVSRVPSTCSMLLFTGAVESIVRMCNDVLPGLEGFPTLRDRLPYGTANTITV